MSNECLTEFNTCRTSVSGLIESWLHRNLVSRFPELTIGSRNGRIEIRGRVNTYYAIQLILASVNNVMKEVNGEPPEEVSVAVHVGNVTIRPQFLCRKK